VINGYSKRDYIFFFLLEKLPADLHIHGGRKMPENMPYVPLVCALVYDVKV
jgi:hypothetical protein